MKSECLEGYVFVFVYKSANEWMDGRTLRYEDMAKYVFSMGRMCIFLSLFEEAIRHSNSQMLKLVPSFQMSFQIPIPG
jgi:hypothetical protein